MCHSYLLISPEVLKGIVALYGKSYFRAAKDTWRLFKDRGIDALVNDQLVGMSECLRVHTFFMMSDRFVVALIWGAYCVGMLCSLLSYIYLRGEHSRLSMVVARTRY